MNGIICETKSFGVGLDSPENTNLGDKFDNLVMAYPIFIDNFWRIFIWWNDIQLWHVFMLYKEKNMKLCMHTIKLHPNVSNTSYFS